MHMKICRNFGVALCFVGVILWLMAGLMLSVSADSAANSLTLICKTEKVTLTGMHWDLYRVGSRKGGNFVLEGDFAKYPVSLEDMSSSAVTEAAKTLENYAVLDKIPALDQGETGKDGLLRFDNLNSGLYMVCGKNIQVGDTIYMPSAILIEIMKSEDGKNVDLDAYPKLSTKTASGENSKYAVKKIWENDENALENRTASISVEIYGDEKLYETVTLDESNDWTYLWMAESDIDWRVKEVKVPENYTVVYSSNEKQFAIVNTYSEKTPNQTTVSTTVASGGSTRPTVITTNPSNGYSNVTSNTNTKLPQTGQLWWPVPVMACGGVIFITVGARLKSGNKRDN